jgi:hypothetical protein
MSLTKRLGLIVGAAASLSSVAMAQSTLDSSRAFANELYSDSSVRASSLAGPAFTPNVHGYTQFRYTYNYRSDDAAALNGPAPAPGIAANTSKNTTGFSNARTAVNISGNVGTEDWGYKVEFAASDTAGGVFLQNAYGTYKIGNGWGLQWGQYKSAFLKESMVGDTNQLAMDRSVTDAYFSNGYVQGVQVNYAADSFRILGEVGDGPNTLNTDYTSGGERDFGLTARGEFMWAGKWDQADQFTSWQNSAFFGMAGAAFTFDNGGSTTGTVKNQRYGLTADVLVKGNGWNGFAAVMYQHIDKNPATLAGGAATSLATDDIGLVLQGGIFVAPQWELFGRIDAIDADTDWGSGTASPGGGGGTFSLGDTFVAITAGANYYVVPDSQTVKFTAEVEFFANRPNGPAAAAGNTLNGLLTSPDGKSGQFQIAAQMQIVF